MNKVNERRELWHPHTATERETVLRELEQIIASSHFCNSKRYPALLRFIVENTLDGKGDDLKERTIGILVFDRPPTYDTNSDTVVRYTAGEVRKRLLLYYSEQDDRSGIRISLPAGAYVPQFLREEDHDHADNGGHPRRRLALQRSYRRIWRRQNPILQRLNRSAPQIPHNHPTLPLMLSAASSGIESR